MRLILKRESNDGTAISGSLAIDGVFECFTLERVAVAIPAGSYPIELTFSPHFGRVLPLLDSVPGRSAIRIHSGNTPPDSEGCILVGSSRANDFVGDSRKAEAQLTSKIGAAIARKEQVTVDVTDATAENRPASTPAPVRNQSGPEIPTAPLQPGTRQDKSLLQVILSLLGFLFAR